MWTAAINCGITKINRINRMQPEHMIITQMVNLIIYVFSVNTLSFLSSAKVTFLPEAITVGF